GSYGRIIAVVYCNGINLNEAILDAGYGWLSSGFCSRSEFSTHAWAQKYGCGTPIQEIKPPQVTTKPTKENQCDPSYPDVCIPPYPPDLNCGDISYRNFKVLQPDPHRFDGDKDGIGCEQ
ncbi:MAG: thermonuclease family protein, partial [Nitrosopumilaceae archaeon]|nr:thermonuclease family protein [Nitrosopumilaceae archaeon]